MRTAAATEVLGMFDLTLYSYLNNLPQVRHVLSCIHCLHEPVSVMSDAAVAERDNNSTAPLTMALLKQTCMLCILT